MNLALGSAGIRDVQSLHMCISKAMHAERRWLRSAELALLRSRDVSVLITQCLCAHVAATQTTGTKQAI